MQEVPRLSFERCQELWEKKVFKIAYNTFLNIAYDENGKRIYKVRLYVTDVVTFFEDGSMLLINGGYRTQTIKKRMNQVLPRGIKVFAKGGKWYVSQGWMHTQCYLNMLPGSIREFNKWTNNGQDFWIPFENGECLIPSENMLLYRLTVQD